MSHHYAGPLAAYNSLTDKHLTGYFNNTRIRRHLQRVGLVTRSGRILSEKEYRMNAMRKDHQKYIRECLAQAIFHKVLDMERHHQIEIKRKLENFARKERVQKIKVDRSKRPEEDGIPLFSPRPPTGPKSSYGRNNLHDGEQSDSSESPSSSRPNTAPGNMQRPVRLEPLPESSGGGIGAVPKTTSATQPKTSALEHDHHFPTGVDKDLLKFISAASDQTSGISPYRLPVINNYVTPVPPPPKKSSRNPNMTRSGTSRGRRFRPTTAPHDLDQLSMKDPVRFHKTAVHSNVAITMIYLGKSVRLSHDDIGYKEEIKVFQQHCGGENLCIYKGNLLEGETFQCTSRRHRGFPFSLTFYINGILVDRLSSCCEYKHRKGARLGGKHGYFRFVNIEGASPCYRCIIAMGLDKKPSPPPKKRKEDPDEEEYEDPKVETMMGKMKSKEQCIEGMQRERSMSATSSAYGADKETSEDKTELEGDAEEEELISEHNQTKDDDDENGDQTKDEYDEDFEAEEDKPDEEVNEEEEAEDLINGKSQSNEDHERDDLNLEMEGTDSSKQAQEASDSDKEERDAYSDTEFEHGEKQGKNIVDDEMLAAATKIQTFYRNRKKYLKFQEKKTDSKSIQEKIAEAIENTEILSAEPEPSDSSTDEEDNLMSTAHENDEVHAVQTMAEDSVADDLCLEDALDTEDQLVDSDSQTNRLLIKESSMTEKGEAATMDFVTEKEATAMETMSEMFSSELDETKEAVGKQGSKLMSVMEDSNKEIIEEQIINQEVAPTEASMKQEMPTQGGTSTDYVESEKEDAVEVEEDNSTVDPVPSSDTHNMLPSDLFEAAEPVVENEITEVDIEGNGVVEDITCEEDVEEESKEALEDKLQMAFEEVDNTEVTKENEAAKEELSLSKEVPNTLENEALEEEELVDNLQQTQHIASECFEDLENAVISSDKNELIDSNKVGEDNELVAENTDTKEVVVEEVGPDRNGAETEKGSNEEVLTNMETLENVDKEGSSSMFEPADEKVPEDLVSEKDIMTEDLIQEDEELAAESLLSEGGVVCDEPLQKEEGAEEIASDKNNNSSLTALEEGDGDNKTKTKALDSEDKAACDGNGSAQETSMADAQELTETALQVQDETIDIQVHENGVEREDVSEGAEQAIDSLCDDDQVCLDISPEKKEPPLDEVLNVVEKTTETITEVEEADAETMEKQNEEEIPSEDQETFVEIDSEDKEQEPAEGGSAEETNEVAEEEVQIKAAETEHSSTGDRTSPEVAMNADEVGHDMLPEVEETVTETQTIGIGQQNTTKEASINEEDSPIVEPVMGEEDILPNEEDALKETDTMKKAQEGPENPKELAEQDEVSVLEGLTPEVVNVVPEAESTEEVAESEEHLKDDEDLIMKETPEIGEISTDVMPDKAIETTVEEELTSGEAASQKEETLAETEEMALTEEVTTEEVLNEGDTIISIEEVATKESVSQESAISGGTTNQEHAVDEIVKLAELIAEESSENKIMENSADQTVEANGQESEEEEETHIPNGKGPDEGTIEHDDYGRELMSEETAAGTSVGLSFDNKGNSDAAVCNNLDVNPEEMLNQAAETMVNELCREGEETTKETDCNAADKESGEITSQIKEDEESTSQGHSNDMHATTGEEVVSGTL